MEAPAPNHGVSIELGDLGSIWANGEYNALQLQSADSAAEHAAKIFERDFGLEIVNRNAMHLATLESWNLLLARGKGEPSGKINFVHLIVALRGVPGEVGVVYMLVLEENARSGRAEGIFAGIAKSFKIREIDR